MRTFAILPPQTICVELGKRIKQCRLRGNLTQQQLAQMVGTSLSSIRRMEGAGQGTLELLVRVSQALQVVTQLDGLFVPAPASIAELERMAQGPARRRARVLRVSAKAGQRVSGKTSSVKGIA
jgi:transcriptional regulator with XRE-family HTH domain